MRVRIMSVRLSPDVLVLSGLIGVCQTAGCAPLELEVPVAATTADGGASRNLQLERSLSRGPQNLKHHVLGDGTEYVEVMRGFQHATVVVIGDAGLEGHCVTNADEALSLLGGR
jgi:hypothetical protein